MAWRLLAAIRREALITVASASNGISSAVRVIRGRQGL